MAILAECPRCHRKQKSKNRKCIKCQTDLDKQKRNDKVIYWIAFRLPGQKNITWERIGFSNDDARAYETDRIDRMNKGRLKTKEDLIPKEPVPEPQDTMTFQELSNWYLEQDFLKDKKSCWQKKNSLKNFNKTFGNRIISSITVNDLLNYQTNRMEKDSKAKATVDNEMQEAKRVINNAYQNDKVNEEVLKRFKSIKKVLKRGANKRKVIITQRQYEDIFRKLPARSREPFMVLRWTGMREGEVLSLTWGQVSPLENRMIRLEADMTKDDEEREIPVTGEVVLYLKERYDQVKDQENIEMKRIFSVTKDQFIYDVRAACREAKAPYGRTLKNGFTAHTLRHTFNTEMALAGISQHIIQELTGHSSDEMFKRYLHIIDETKRKAIEQYEEWVRNGDRVNKNVNKVLQNSTNEGNLKEEEDQAEAKQPTKIIEVLVVPKRGLEPLQELLPTRP